MTCSRCNYILTVVSEYYDFDDNIYFRDMYCIKCTSGLTEKFYENGKYSSEWIDFSV
jgi:hypothetical protein